MSSVKSESFDFFFANLNDLDFLDLIKKDAVFLSNAFPAQLRGIYGSCPFFFFNAMYHVDYLGMFLKRL